VKRVYATNNNCLQAAIASVLEIPLKEAPNVACLPSGSVNKNYMEDIVRWAKRRGLGVVHFWWTDKVRLVIPSLFDVWVVAIGHNKNCEHDESHAVVCRALTEDGEVSLTFEHDPARTKLFVDPIEHCFFFVPLRPVKL
jgi:hypothetical protein